MTVTTESGVLSWVATQLQSVTPASPASATARVYAYPDDYASVSTTLPFIIVRVNDSEIPLRGASLREFVRDYDLLIDVYTAAGALEIPGTAHGASELKARAWEAAILDWLLDNTTLNDLVRSVATNSVSATSRRNYLQWNQQPYDGVTIRIPITQQARCL